MSAEHVIVETTAIDEALVLLRELATHERLRDGMVSPEVSTTVVRLEQARRVELIHPHLTRHGAQIPASWVEVLP